MEEKNKHTIPLLPLRGLLVYPTMVMHLDVGRDRSVQALEQAMMEDHLIFLSTQKDMTVDQPEQEDLYSIGTLTKVKQMLKLPNGTIRVLVEGLERAKITSFVEGDSFYKVEIESLPDQLTKSPELEALMRMLTDYFKQYISLSEKVSNETLNTVTDIEEPGHLADIVASHLPLKIKLKQEILNITDIKQRLTRVIETINNEKEVLSLEKKISQRVKKSMERTQKEYYLREQMKAIQKELGDKDGKTEEITDLSERIKAVEMPDSILKIAMKELDRYEKVPSTSAESSVIRNYLEWLITVPWTTATDDDLDIKRAEEI